MCEHDLLFDLTCLQKRFAKKRFRKQIFEDWGSCAYCGKENPTTLDHVVPKAQGGSTTRQNLIAACGDCNILKSAQNWYSWFRAQDFWTPEREDRILRWVNQSDADPLPLVPVYWSSEPIAA
jgi:5-methylcytosine-specific restriction endonuclease McrA